ncbi:MAG: response regulator [Deltaproteobacteria bacterium]|nr:response regulator [Deltaproteobacteria bacterium]
MQHKILIVEEEGHIAERIKDVPSLRPYTMLFASSPEQALTLLSKNKVDVIVSDEDLTAMSGLEFLAFARQKCPDAIQMILTGDTNFKTAMRAINDGKIYRLFSKPCNGVDMALTIHCVLHKKNYLKRIIKVCQKTEKDDQNTSGIDQARSLVL